MMDGQTVNVTLAVGAVTLAMLYYARKHLPEKLDRRTRESMKAFSTAVELRFPSREGLSNRVVTLSQELGKRSGLSRSELKRLEIAARLRDIGLCAIPYRLINEKPMRDWTEEERGLYDRHPEIGAAMLELVPSLSHVAHLVRCHQAAYDGSDGPCFPARDSIPAEARVLKITSDYVWFERTQGALLAKEALGDRAGHGYDPDMVWTFLAMLTSTRVGEPAEPVFA